MTHEGISEQTVEYVSDRKAGDVYLNGGIYIFLGTMFQRKGILHTEQLDSYFVAIT